VGLTSTLSYFIVIIIIVDAKYKLEEEPIKGTEIELRSFKGRTNKLVDGCYSWCCGGCFALLEAFAYKEEEEECRTSIQNKFRLIPLKDLGLISMGMYENSLSRNC
jgi:hypothetical protein